METKTANRAYITINLNDNVIFYSKILKSKDIEHVFPSKTETSMFASKKIQKKCIEMFF